MLLRYFLLLMFTLGWRLRRFYHHYLRLLRYIILWHRVSRGFIVEFFFNKSLIKMIEVRRRNADSFKLYRLFIHYITCLINNFMFLRRRNMMLFFDIRNRLVLSTQLCKINSSRSSNWLCLMIIRNSLRFFALSKFTWRIK